MTARIIMDIGSGYGSGLSSTVSTALPITRWSSYF
jgi:hypothetical protein